MNPKLESFLKQVLIETCIHSKRFSDEEKVKGIKLIHESLAMVPIMVISDKIGEFIFPRLRNAGLSLSKKIANLSQSTSSKRTEDDIEELMELRKRYKEIMERYENIKNGGTLAEKRDLKQEVDQLVSDIRAYNQKKKYGINLERDSEEDSEEEYDDEYNIEGDQKQNNITVDDRQSSIDYVDSTSDSFDSDNAPMRSARSGSINSEIVTKIESDASQLWNKIAFTKCNQLSLKSLWKCRANAADRAILYIRSKNNLCSNAIDPESCRSSLSTLIKNWNVRKQGYLRRAR